MIKCLNPISLLLIIIGGLNWLLVGLFRFNLVNELFYKMPAIERTVYILVGIAAIFAAPLFMRLWSESCKKQK